MRVVSGKYKGFNLKVPKSKTTRPTDNKVKEAIFAMLYPMYTEGIALDLFAGSGQMGIEFLSRGMDTVYFNELNRDSFKVLTENLEKIKDTNFDLSKKDYKLALKTYRDRGLKFDYIFLDPPYEGDMLADAIELILSYELLNDNGIIITESDKNHGFSEDFDLNLLKEKIYGRKIIKIYQK